MIFMKCFQTVLVILKSDGSQSLGKQVLDSYIDEKKWEGEGVIFASLSNSPINGELEDIREKIGKDMPLFLTTVRIPHETFEEESNSKIKIRRRK